MRGLKGQRSDSHDAATDNGHEEDGFGAPGGSYDATATTATTTTNARQSASSVSSTRLCKTRTNDTIPRPCTPEHKEHAIPNRRTPSNASSTCYPTYSLYPAPTKPLPALPPGAASSSSRSIGRPRSEHSAESSRRSSHYSDRSGSIAAGPGGSFSFSFKSPTSTQYTAPSEPQHGEQHAPRASLELCFRSMVASSDRRANNSVYYLDVSPTSSRLATKHGNNTVKVWSLETGSAESVVRFSSYTEAQSRSRDYLIRSHAVLSETSRLLAVATRFGRSIEIWDWEKKRRLQTLDNADRWSAGKMDVYGPHGWARLATYRGETGVIDLYAAARGGKPLVKRRCINLAEAGLPFVPQYPELALSPTSPLLVAAAGPRPPRRGHPPPDRETLLVAWETHDAADAAAAPVGSRPYRVARPWQHREIDTAIPSDLVTYGSVVVSIWIPATFRAVPAPAARGGTGHGHNYSLTPVKVPSRYVLVWDLAANSTRTFAIPNCTCCISPDCRYVAYCHASGAAIGARGTVAVVDVMSSQEVWCWPDRDATAMHSGPRPGLKQLEDLARVTELAFSADSKSLLVADADGRVGVYDMHGREDAEGAANVAVAY